jgi:ABC-type sugar transport system permease subunit
LREFPEVLVFDHSTECLAVDWIEKLFGFSPDGGDGSAEAAIVFVCVILLAAVIVWRMPSLRERLKSFFVASKPK